MIICDAEAGSEPDRRLREVTRQALDALQDGLREGQDEIGRLDECIQAIITARRAPRRPEPHAVRHACLAAITIQLCPDVFSHDRLFAPCPDPEACRLEEAARLLLAAYHGDHHFVIGMASTRAMIWPHE